MFMRLDVDESGRLKRGSPVTQEPLISDYHVELHTPEAPCKPWPRNLHCRRKLHKAFLQWYSANKPRFAIKLELIKRTGAGLEIGFCKTNRLLTAYLGHNEITVSVESQGTYWDTILDLDASPKRVSAGYVCDFCPAEQRQVFPSPEALWRDHLFEPFLEWINNDLAKADAISITGTPDWIGSARLITG